MTTEPNPPQGTTEPGTAQPAAPPKTDTAIVDSAAVAAPSAPPPAPPAEAAEVDPVIVAARALRIDVVLLVFLLVLTFFLGSFAAMNSDLWMELAIGKRLSEGQLTLGVDPFSWATEATATQPAPYWVHQGWITSWLFYQLDQLGGSVLVVLKAILFVLAIALLSRITWNDTGRWFGLICLTMTALAVSHRLLLQPVVVSYLFLSITLLILARAGFFAQPIAEAEGAKPRCTLCLWYLPPLFALWANLDQWFILGPLLVGLCWASTGLMLWFGSHPSTVSGKTLGLVFAAGLLACVVNPHHVRVFQLPTELAYVLVSLKIPLPDSLVGAGRTIQQLDQAGLAAFWTLSPVAKVYWQTPGLGLNIAGIAALPLFVLGAAAFALTAFAKPQPGSPSLHLGRFLPWLVFSVLALSLYRLIPFFAIVAAPLSAMTLGEFLQWQQQQSGISAGRRDRGLNMARWISVPFMLLLLYLAWPGWLHGSMESYNSERRVAWHVRPSSSLQQAAATLQGLKKADECGNVFNVGFETASYCSWFAPDVKCFMDTRFALFVNRVDDYVKVHQALLSERRQQIDWQAFFADHKINQVVLTSLLDSKRIMRMADQASLIRWWGDADHWRERYYGVFSWAGPNKQWPTDTVTNDWNRRAFGEVPAEQRPPYNGTMPPQPLSPWDLYSQGVAPQPQKLGEAQLLRLRYHSEHQMSQVYRFYSFVVMCGSLSATQTTPGGGQMIFPSFASLLHTISTKPIGDYGPPALPVLMVRTARLAVADNPQDADCQIMLKDAYELLRTCQEDYWIGYQDGPHPSRLRERLRYFQTIAALYNVSVLQPDRADPHFFLAEIYRRNLLMDASLEQLKLAEAAVEARKAATKNPPDPKKFEAFQDENKRLERDLRQRLAKLKEMAGGKSAIEVAELAYRGPYLDEKGGQTRLGLANKAMEILAEMKSPTPEEEARRQRLMLELSISLGHMEPAAAILKQPGLDKVLPPMMLAQYRVFVSGVLGDYELLNKALQDLEGYLRENAGVRLSVHIASLQSAPGMQPAYAYLPHLWLQSLQMTEPYNDLYNTATLHGIAALEAGQTKKAQTIFRTILESTGEKLYFSERRIAERYLELLNSQLPKK